MTGNPDCEDAGYGYGFKLNDPTDGTYTLTQPPGELTGGAPPNPGNSVTIDVYSSGGQQFFDWESTLGIDAVIVKGGNNANVYDYNPEATADDGLHAPINPANSKYYGISHIEFCWDEDPPEFTGKVRGKKFYDLDQDGQPDQGEPNLVDWTIFLFKIDTGNSNAILQQWSMETNNVVGYEFTGLTAGTYVVCEVLPDGWVQTRPWSAFSNNNFDAFDCSTLVNAPEGLAQWGYEFTYDGTENKTFTGGLFGNYRDITGNKFGDLNRNGEWDEGEPGLEGWKIYLCVGGEGNLLDQVLALINGPAYECISTLTDADGFYSFPTDELEDGEEYYLCEVLKDGWEQTYPSATSDPEPFDCSLLEGADGIDAGDVLGPYGHALVYEPGEDGWFDFGNWEEEGDDDDDVGDDDDDDDDDDVTPTPTPEPEEAVLPFLGPNISKSASVTAAALGDTIVWTVQVARPDGVTAISDTVPAGLDLVSATADKGTVATDGNAVTVDISAVPVGEVVTLTLETTVNATADTGELCNTAFAGALSAEACVNLFPVILPDLGGSPVEPISWVWVGLAGAAALGMGGYVLKRRLA